MTFRARPELAERKAVHRWLVNVLGNGGKYKRDINVPGQGGRLSVKYRYHIERLNPPMSGMGSCALNSAKMPGFVYEIAGWSFVDGSMHAHRRKSLRWESVKPGRLR